jgi:hypothetical protein
VIDAAEIRRIEEAMIVSASSLRDRRVYAHRLWSTPPPRFPE